MHDIRFIRSSAKLGLCASLGPCDCWLSTDHWPDCVDAPAPHYDFKAEARWLATTSPDESAEVPAAPAPMRALR